MDKETSHVSAILPTRPPSRRPSIIFKRQITRSKRCLRGPASLVDFDRIDQPVSLAEIKVLTLHISLASWIAGQLCTALSLACVSVVPKFLVAGPFAADCVGEDADVVEEVLVGVTVVSRPAGLWCTPTGGVRLTSSDIGRCLVAREEPRLDTRVFVPSHSMNSAALIVVRHTKVISHRRLHSTTLVARLGRCAVGRLGEIGKLVATELRVGRRVDLASGRGVD